MLAWSVAAFATAPTIGLIVVAAPPGSEQVVERIAAAAAGATHVIVVTGGASRAESVGLGLAEVPASAEIVAVHDAARPLVSVELIEALIARLESEPAAAGVIAAEPVSDTIKQVQGGSIIGTADRSALWAAQTPQLFRAGRLRAAHDDVEAAASATDDAMLIERLGGTVLVEAVGGPNLKVTTPADLAVAESLLVERNTR